MKLLRWGVTFQLSLSGRSSACKHIKIQWRYEFIFFFNDELVFSTKEYRKQMEICTEAAIIH